MKWNLLTGACLLATHMHRHLLLSCGEQFSSDMWQVACSSLCQALTLTLEPVQMVLAQFSRFSSHISGHHAHVKVTCKKNMNVATAFRVLHLAKQASDWLNCFCSAAQTWDELFSFGSFSGVHVMMIMIMPSVCGCHGCRARDCSFLLQFTENAFSEIACS